MLLFSPLVFFYCFTLSAQLEILSCDTINLVDENQCVFPEVTLTNSAISDGSCANDSIYWYVLVDAWGDGVYDYEYSSSLETSDNDITEDSNQNGMPDIYLPPSLSGEEVFILIQENIEMSLFIHSVRWKAMDACGSEIVCNSGFVIKDLILPSIECVQEITTGISDYYPVLELDDFLVSGSDNCTAMEDLVYSFDATLEDTDVSYSAFDGDTSLTLYLFDESGNSSSCVVELNYYQSPFPFTGVVKNVNDVALDGVSVFVERSSWLSSQISDENGHFTACVSQDFDYSIQASFDDGNNGISTRDLLQIQDFINDNNSFLNPFGIIACDVDHNFEVDDKDIEYLRELLFEERVDTGLWRFLYGRIEFEDESKPFPYDEGIEHTAESEWHWKELLGVKLGDVDHSAFSASLGLDSIQLTIENKFVYKNHEVDIDFFLPKGIDVRGFQFAIDTDMDFVGVKSGAAHITNEDISSTSSRLLITCTEADIMTDEIAFTLSFISSKSGELASLIKGLDNNPALGQNLVAEVYINADLETHPLQLRVEGEPAYKTKVFDLKPNPIYDGSMIDFELGSEAKVGIKIIDTYGRLSPYEVDLGSFNKGKHSYFFDRNDYNIHSGIYLFQFVIDYKAPNQGNAIFVKKAIIIESK